MRGGEERGYGTEQDLFPFESRTRFVRWRSCPCTQADAGWSENLLVEFYGRVVLMFLRKDKSGWKKLNMHENSVSSMMNTRDLEKYTGISVCDQNV